jgi:Protein of unknown function (DUF4231)
MSADASSSWLAQEFGGVVDDFDLDERQRRFVQARWLDQMAWFDAKARQSQRRYYLLRLVAIVGGLIVPALVSLNIHQDTVRSTIAWATFTLSLVVGISVAVDGFFNYGGRWRQYRRTAELLKGHGWQYFELVGVYSGFRTHRAAFPRFAAAVEALIAEDVEAYLSKVMREQQHGEQQAGQEAKHDEAASSHPLPEA